MPINTYTYKNNCPQGQYRTKENHLIIPTLGISEWVECGGLQILILNGSGLQIQTNGTQWVWNIHWVGNYSDAKAHSQFSILNSQFSILNSEWGEDFMNKCRSNDRFEV